MVGASGESGTGPILTSLRLALKMLFTGRTLCSRCFRETGRRGSQRRPRILRLVAIAALITVGGIGTAAYFGFNAARNRDAIVSRVGDAGAHYDRGLALHNQGKLAEAIDEYRAALCIIPGSAETHYNLGVALRSQGDIDAAIAEFRKPRDNAQRGSELAQLIERALTDTDH